MRRTLSIGIVVLALAAIGGWIVWRGSAPPRRDVIIFVADGLRSGIVSDQTAPELALVRREGVDFRESHSLFPTVTTPNASAIATGHLLGDTGDFGNYGYGGQMFAPPVGAMTAVLEDDAALGVMNAYFGGNYLNETSLLAAARAHGYVTASVGKLGPVAVQDIRALQGGGGLIVDDATGLAGAGGAPLPDDLVRALKVAGLGAAAPDRGLNTDPGTDTMPGVRVANVDQQNWFADVVTRVLLPRFKASGRPFVLVFWSRDPDGTQHNEGDSLNSLTPGINGPTSLAGIRNASSDLGQLRAALHAQGLDQNTDIFVTADHGFSTASKQSQTSAAAKLRYADVPAGYLPPGFLAIDLAEALNLPLHNSDGLDVAPHRGEHPRGYGMTLGPAPVHPIVTIAANGGSDELWLDGPGRRALASRIVAALTTEDYVSAIFVDDALGPIPGTLPTSLIGLRGASRTPTPAIVVSFRSFSTGCATPSNCAVEVADTELQQGEGIHGAFQRGDTFNFMAAVGPDFKRGFVDTSPVSNADIAVTLARLMHLPLRPKGKLTGRVLSEALAGGPAPAPPARRSVRSAAAASGFVTQLDISEGAGSAYFDEAGMPGSAFGLRP